MKLKILPDISFITKFNFTTHCCIGLTIRLLFIFYGVIQDRTSEIQYTDIDYKVFTDASRYILQGVSPYKRHTYRYSPLLAILLVPNLLIHETAGKIIFSIFDIFITVTIKNYLVDDGLPKMQSIKYSLFWLYNPLSIVITTRGNADSIAALLVIMTLYLFKKKHYFHAGLLHGLAVHIRIYPLIFSLPLYLCIKNKNSQKLFHQLYPTKGRLQLIFGSLLIFASLTIFFYLFYGYEFLYETLLYHIKRTDIRHNYSVFFYYQYLTFGRRITSVYKLLMATPQLLLLTVLPFYYKNPKDIAFCEMCMAFILVSYNSVLTCQYFIWYLCLIPLCLPYMQFNLKRAVLVSSMWVLSQLFWLLPAYLLEFKSKQTFLMIWIQGLVFFMSNIVVLGTMLKCYYGQYNVVKSKTK